VSSRNGRLLVSAPTPDIVERWLAEFGVQTLERAERDGVTSWDVVLDGQRRFDVRLTLILDPTLAMIVWVQYAPPINDAFRKSYRRLLRWNDEFPFVKFTISEDERPILTVEIPIERLGRDELGLAVARVLAVCDRLMDESVDWLWPDGRRPDVSDRASRGAALLDRFRAPLGELGASADRPENIHERGNLQSSDAGETRPVAAETR
jgi:hypothetical protein